MYILNPLGILLLFLFMVGAGIYVIALVVLAIVDTVKHFKKKKDPPNPYG